MILTPKQIEHVNPSLDWSWKLQDEMKDTLLAYADIVQRVAEMDPIIETGWSQDMFACCMCWSHDDEHDKYVWFRREDVQHTPDCPYLAARQLVGLE